MAVRLVGEGNGTLTQIDGTLKEVWVAKLGMTTLIWEITNQSVLMIQISVLKAFR